MHFTSILLAGIIASASCSAYSQETAPYPPAPADVSNVATLVSNDEPGERLVINGTVYQSDGRTPLSGFVLYLYQTDATGVYNKTDRKWWRPRIRGWVKTDKDGRYEIRTIKPGSYPGSRNPAHIHVIVKTEVNEPDWIDDYLFEGDPFLTDKDRHRMESDGRFSPVMRLVRDQDGTLRCARDIRIPSVKMEHPPPLR